MNIRSLTRGDGVVIGAAVVLFIASFLDSAACAQTCAGAPMPNAWDNGALLLGLYLAGVIAAVLVVVGRSLAHPRKVAGLDIGQLGIALALFAAWTSIGAIADPAGPFDLVAAVDAGAGLVLGLIAALVMAAAAVATPLVPVLRAPLLPAPRPQGPHPYGPQGPGYPGGPQYGQTPYSGGTFGGDPAAAGGEPGATQAPAFAPFWFAVPVTRPLYGEDGSPAPVAELSPGTWYLAVEQRGAALVAQTQDGRRGILQDTTGIQRG